jgi:hypothetical protein
MVTSATSKTAEARRVKGGSGREAVRCRGTQCLHCLVCLPWLPGLRDARKDGAVAVRRAGPVAPCPAYPWRLESATATTPNSLEEHQAHIAGCLGNFVKTWQRVAIKCGSGCPLRTQSPHSVTRGSARVPMHAPLCQRVGRYAPDTAGSCIQYTVHVEQVTVEGGQGGMASLIPK